MVLQLKGPENRRKRAVTMWKKFYKDYNDKKNPLTVEQIAKKYKKRNGQQYHPKYIYKALRLLDEELTKQKHGK